MDVLDEAGNPQGKRVHLDGIQLSHQVTGDVLSDSISLEHYIIPEGAIH